MKPTTAAETAFLSYLRQIGAEREDSLREYRRLMADTRARPNLTVAPNTPDVIFGCVAVGAALGMETPWQLKELTTYLKAPFDPLPARLTIRGVQVLRSRLELWCQRVGYYDVPRPGLPVIEGRDAIALAVGISVPTLKLYLRGEGERIKPPVTQGKPSWCYEDALKDWATSLSISYALEAQYKGKRDASLAAIEDESEAA